jgi:hypothetical protein
MEGSWETETVVEGFKEEFKAQQEIKVLPMIRTSLF